MNSVFYVSPSTLPSRTANSVHVAHQCDAFSRLGMDVTLVAKRAVDDAGAFAAAVRTAYGVAHDRVRYLTYASRHARGDNLRIAALGLRNLPRGDAALLLSRNLYASYVIGVLWRRPMLFETHQLESGMRKPLQRAIMTRCNVITVVISDQLRVCLAEHHGVAPAHAVVAHDAAPDGIQPLAPHRKRAVLSGMFPDLPLADSPATCGYFGHLYPGRGLDIIAEMARERPHIPFLIFGGNERDIAAWRDKRTLPNLHFLGFIPHPAAQTAMAALDILLMPYQRRVSIGVAGHDTGRWMSPMKMFEYMASGTATIASDLPVLREVLTEGRTALFAAPDDASEWLRQLDLLVENPQRRHEIGRQAHEDYAARHTWTVRARTLLAAAPR